MSGRMGFSRKGFLLAAGLTLLAFGAATQPASAAGKKVTCSIPSATGPVTIPLVDQGLSRPFTLYVPSGYDGHRRIPLLLSLHATNSSGTQQMEITAMEAVAKSRGVAVVAPNGGVVSGTGFAWNVPGVELATGVPVPEGSPSDEAYLMNVIRAAKKKLCIDPYRVSFTGYSGGARMSSQMACSHSRQIASVSPVAGLRAGVPRETSPDVWAPDNPTCQPAKVVAVQAFHGTDDTVNPYEGNDDPRWGYTVDAAAARWAKLDRCKRTRTFQVTSTVKRVFSDRCAPGSSVSLYRLEGGGHTWPGSTLPSAWPIDTSINASRLIVKFAKTNSLTDRHRPKRRR